MKLIFVYNANSGKLNGYLDSLHKVISPKTYPCSLCDITYGVLKIKPEWQSFKDNTDLDLEFHHLDEFKNKFGADARARFTYPIILNEENNVLREFISKAELDNLKNEKELITLINLKTTGL
ncbi:GTPase [Leeuwenhoekiella sp. NPDC079379]|uniref:GTPase n=1 Tax=Leeuwenhoekiella sp. NPDC079379 TaxID=3364122 RepID=UPI0037C9B201